MVCRTGANFSETFYKEIHTMKKEMEHEPMPRMVYLYAFEYYTVRQVVEMLGLGSKGFSLAIRMIIRDYSKRHGLPPLEFPTIQEKIHRNDTEA
jgi:hypothetical protein